MKLLELDATFVKHLTDGNFIEVATLKEADGVLFDCPKCQRHSILTWNRSIPSNIEPGPGRWDMRGNGLHDLTLTPSIDLSRNNTGCLWHGYVTNGDAT